MSLPFCLSAFLLPFCLSAFLPFYLSLPPLPSVHLFLPFYLSAFLPFCLSAFLPFLSALPFAPFFLSFCCLCVSLPVCVALVCLQSKHNFNEICADRISQRKREFCGQEIECSGQEIEQSFLSPTPAENQAYAIAPSEKLIESEE